MERVSPRMREFFARFDQLIAEQDAKQEQDEEEAHLRASLKLTERAVQQTIDELLSLDPAADEKRAKELARDLAGMGKPAREALVALLDADLPPDHRRLVIMALGRFNDAVTGRLLYDEALKARDAKSRAAALAAIKGTKAAGELVHRSAANLSSRAGTEDAPNRADSMAHIAVLGTLGGDEAVMRLMDVVRSSDDVQVRTTALAALGDTGGDDAAVFLKDVLRNDRELRDAAARALGSMKREDIVIGFGEVIMDTANAPDMRIAAVKGLGQDNGSLARTILLNTLRDTRQPREVHQQAVAALTSGFTQGADAETMRYLSLFERTTVKYLPQMMQQLIARGGDFAAMQLDARFDRFDQTKKIHTVRTVARIGGPHAFAMLLKRLDTEKEPAVRREIIAAMKACRGDNALPELTSKIAGLAGEGGDPQERISALAFLADIAPSDAVRIAEGNVTSSDDRAVVRASIDILRRHGGSDSESVLNDLKRRDKKGEYTVAIDGAMKAIDARNK